jgi:hypothetical protein
LYYLLNFDEIGGLHHILKATFLVFDPNMLNFCRQLWPKLIYKIVSRSGSADSRTSGRMTKPAEEAKPDSDSGNCDA